MHNFKLHSVVSNETLLCLAKMFIPQLPSHEVNIFVEVYVQKCDELTTERKNFVGLKGLFTGEETKQTV